MNKLLQSLSQAGVEDFNLTGTQYGDIIALSKPASGTIHDPTEAIEYFNNIQFQEDFTEEVGKVDPLILVGTKAGNKGRPVRA